MSITLKWNKPLNIVIRDDAKINERTMLFAATDWHRLYNDFVPMRTGLLAGNVAYHATDTRGEIVHKAPYAHYQYYGIGFKHSHNAHPLASAQWDQIARGAGRAHKLAADIQRFIARG